MSAADGMVKPGWYWHHYDAASGKAVSDFIRATPQMRVRVSFRGHTSGTEAFVFEVLAPFRWTLPGYPTVAPKRAKTRIEDLANGPPPPPAVVALIEEITGKAFDEVKRTVSNANTAVTLLVFGGAAILLWNLNRGTSFGSSERWRPGERWRGDEEDEEADEAEGL